MFRRSSSLFERQSEGEARPARWIIVGLALVALIALVAHAGPLIGSDHWTDSKKRITTLVLFYVAAGAIYATFVPRLAALEGSRSVVLWILVAGLLMRLGASTAVIPQSDDDDYRRFLWDGAVTAAGHDPYFARPADFKDVGGDARGLPADLRVLAVAGRDSIEHINHPELTTIYPPLAQVAFAVAHRLRPFDLMGLRIVYLTVELCLLAALAGLLGRLGRPMPNLAVYWWNPIAIKETYFGLHMDCLPAALALFATALVVAGRRHGALAALAAGVAAKLWPLLLLPILSERDRTSRRMTAIRTGIFLLLVGALLWPLLRNVVEHHQSGLAAYSRHWINNAGAFGVLHAATSRAQELGLVADSHLLARGLAGLAILAVTAKSASRRGASANDLVRRTMLTIGGLFLLIPTQFPWYYIWLIPFLAASPSTPLLLYSALLPLYHLHRDHPWVLWVEHGPVWFLILLEFVVRSRRRPAVPESFSDDRFTPPAGAGVSVIIPALNEERSIGAVLAAIPRWANRIIVVDNGSTDRTAAIAANAGAEVLHQTRRGYGAACLEGLSAIDGDDDVVVFLDADLSDSPELMGRLVAPIYRGEVDMVIGSRTLGEAAKGSIAPHQRFGNALACLLIRILYGKRFTDLGPFRAVRVAVLRRLEMDDLDFGWTVQMQVRAAERGIRVLERPMPYRRRIGKSKISGTFRGSWAAGKKIIRTILRERRTRGILRMQPERLIVFARVPVAGSAKTRLIPLLGPEGAADLHRQLTSFTLAAADRLESRRRVECEVRFTGGSVAAMAEPFGAHRRYRDQGGGDLGERLLAASDQAFREGAEAVVMIGTDCPSVDVGVLDAGYRALESSDVVIGRARDGGYYLIGLRRSTPRLFRDIPWGTSEVFERTIAACRAEGLIVHRLAERLDVDRPSDLAEFARSRATVPNRLPAISVVIPALNEESRIAAAIVSALAFSEVEVIVVDGGSTDRTVAVARALGATIVRAVASRAVQMNRGAAVARSDVLLFLHADTTLPDDYARHVFETLEDRSVAAGAFRFTVDLPGSGARWLERGVSIRSRLCGRPYGDQAMFMPRRVFRAIGGFPRLAKMEDYAVLGRLASIGRLVIADAGIRTSGRRWQAHGIVLTTIRHQAMIARFRLGFGRKEIECDHEDRSGTAGPPAATAPSTARETT